MVALPLVTRAAVPVTSPQSITLLWTLLRQGLEGKPTVRRALIVCPTSLVKNWSNELKKWLDGKVRVCMRVRVRVCPRTHAWVV